MDKINETETSDIQTYLASFNKEIECDDLENGDSGNENENCQVSDAEYVNAKAFYAYASGEELDDENNSEIKIKTEYEDPEFYNSYSNEDHNESSLSKVISPRAKKKSAEIIRLGSKKDSSANEEVAFSENNETIVPVVEELHIDDQRTLEMVAQFAEEAAKASQNNDVIGAYQTVTVVPSDTNPGELSYVVFVSEPGSCLAKDGDDMNVALYDINGNEAFNDSFLTKQIASDRVKMRTIRLSSRRNPLNNYRNCIQQHVCNFCSYTSTKRYLLSRHMKSHSDERPHKCGVCERGFKTLASLQNHVNTHTGTRPHPCKECDSCFTTSGELVRHVRYKHTHEKPHKCTECDYASVELSKLKRHMRCHTGERPYQCPHCTYASPDTYKLKRHLRIHTGEKPYECDICQTRFTQSNSLKAHKLIHSGNKPVFHCEYCPATCGRKTDLRIHMEKLHSSDNPHRCNRCGKVFLDRYSYKIHIKSHEGEKCFKCDLCSYASISQRHLETHMFVHTDQKPFRCDECDQSFRQKQLLKRHKNIYHDPNYVPPEPKAKPHVCCLCSKAFRHRGNLVRHFALHDPDATIMEKEAAMRLGKPKNPGEDQDGEEDDIDYIKNSEKPDQQVVVFEVIQLPSSNSAHSEEQTVTMIDGNTLMLNDGDTHEYSIIEQADDNVNNFLTFNDSVSDPEDVENISSVTSGHVNTKIIAGVQNKLHATGKKSKNREDIDKSSHNYNSQNGRPPSKKPRILKVVAHKEKTAKEQAPIQEFSAEETLVQKEKDLEHAKEFEAQKNFECFSFEDKEEQDDDDDDDGGLLTMSPSTGYQAFHSTLVQDIS